MKKQYTIVALLFIMTAVLTGCSWSEFKAKITGNDSASGTAVTQNASGPVVIEDYNVDDCITLGTYKGVDVDCTVSDSELQSEIDTFLSNHVKETKIKSGTVASGTSINIDFTGKVDGKEFDGGSAQGYEVVAGNSGFIDGFDEGMIGMKVGQTKDLKLKFPDNYTPNAKLSGKDVVFTVKINYIVKTSKRKFNDAFVKKYSDDGYKTVSEYKEKTLEKLKKDKISNAGSTALGAVMQSATVKKLPDTLKEAYRKYYDQLTKAQIKSYYGESADFETILASQGMTKDQYEQQLSLAAESYAKQQLVCEAIAAKEGIKVTDDAVKAFVKEQSNTDYETGKKQYETNFGTDAAMTYDQMNKTYYLITKVMEFLKNNANIKK